MLSTSLHAQTIWFLPTIFRIMAIELPSAIQLSVESLVGQTNHLRLKSSNILVGLNAVPIQAKSLMGTSFETITGLRFTLF
jgi:hypothetical protein